ncbi:MAG: 3'(2'),5'-bisphosphate nucleotidase CysQ [Beijerinckiaceae bacterium]|nr:3'(2'),5'-bisphosphate nucleotidase CysQ [Beijerinckiaceae bacterium]
MTRVHLKDRDALAMAFATIAVAAGRIVMQEFCSAFAVNAKGDGSPVTQADKLAEHAVVSGLRVLLPGVQIVAEEACSARLETHADEEFVLVDALDGTAEFVARRSDFTVNIALVSNRQPVAGCVFSPASGELYVGGGVARAGLVAKNGNGLPEMKDIFARLRGPSLTAAVSRSHLDEKTEQFLNTQHVGRLLTVGSSIKFCRIAEGKADVYPRFGRTMEWDTAAGHAVLAAAGGSLVTPEGEPLRYGKATAGFANGPFVAWGR